MKVKEFLDTISSRADAEALLKEYKNLDTAEAYAAALAEVGEKLGLEVDKAELTAFCIKLEEERKAKTDKAAEKVKTTLADDDLDDVAGGFYYVDPDVEGKRVYDKCHQTVAFGPDTICNVADRCFGMLNIYYDCKTNHFKADEDKDCIMFES